MFWCKGCGRLCGWGFEIEKASIEEWEADGELCVGCLEKQELRELEVSDPNHHDNMMDALFNE